MKNEIPLFLEKVSIRRLACRIGTNRRDKFEIIIKTRRKESLCPSITKESICNLIISSKLSRIKDTYNTNKKGPKMDLCGTPQVNGRGIES